MNPVIAWFGDDFFRLAPLLQDLHRQGGDLSGTVDVTFGHGRSGVVGRRLAAKLGIPRRQGRSLFRVSISHDDRALYWARRFDDRQDMVSVFVPHGNYPDGCWRETTGHVSLNLGVEIRDGGWYWIQRRSALWGLPLPTWLFPTTHAHKRVANGMYEFSVAISSPWLGKLVGYSGILGPADQLMNTP